MSPKSFRNGESQRKKGKTHDSASAKRGCFAGEKKIVGWKRIRASEDCLGGIDGQTGRSRSSIACKPFRASKPVSESIGQRPPGPTEWFAGCHKSNFNGNQPANNVVQLIPTAPPMQLDLHRFSTGFVATLTVCAQIGGASQGANLRAR